METLRQWRVRGSQMTGKAGDRWDCSHVARGEPGDGF